MYSLLSFKTLSKEEKKELRAGGVTDIFNWGVWNPETYRDLMDIEKELEYSGRTVESLLQIIHTALELSEKPLLVILPITRPSILFQLGVSLGKESSKKPIFLFSEKRWVDLVKGPPRLVHSKFVIIK